MREPCAPKGTSPVLMGPSGGDTARLPGSELKTAGFTDEQAKIQAKALFKVIDQQLVTKQDLKELETKLSYDIKELDVKLSYEIQDIKRDISEMGKDILIKLGGLMVSLFAVSGVVVAILFKFMH